MNFSQYHRGPHAGGLRLPLVQDSADQPSPVHLVDARQSGSSGNVLAEAGTWA